MKNDNAIEGLILFLFSGFFIRESLKFHRTGGWELSPALFPLIITIGILLFSIILIYKGMKGQEKRVCEKGDSRGVIALIALSFLYLYFLTKLGFVLTSLIYILLFMWVLGERRWYLLASISLLTPLLIYYIFVNLFDVFLP